MLLFAFLTIALIVLIRNICKCFQWHMLENYRRLLVRTFDYLQVTLHRVQTWDNTAICSAKCAYLYSLETVHRIKFFTVSTSTALRQHKNIIFSTCSNTDVPACILYYFRVKRDTKFPNKSVHTLMKLEYC